MLWGYFTMRNILIAMLLVASSIILTNCTTPQDWGYKYDCGWFEAGACQRTPAGENRSTYSSSSSSSTTYSSSSSSSTSSYSSSEPKLYYDASKLGMRECSYDPGASGKCLSFKAFKYFFISLSQMVKGQIYLLVYHRPTRYFSKMTFLNQ